MIQMFCDRCGDEIRADVNGGARLRTANRELAFHLCPAHQKELRVLVDDFCTENAPREVSQPTLSGRR